MIILSQERLRDYWDNIARGFEKSPLEIVASIVFLVVLIVVPLVLFVLWQKREKRKKIGIARDLFESLSEKKGISTADIGLFEQLSAYAPKGERDLPALLTNAQTFNLSIKKMGRDTRISDSRVAALRVKLGFTQPGR